MSDTHNTTPSEAPEAPEKTFCIELSGMVFTTVEVEAADENEAREIALDRTRFGHPWDEDVSDIQVGTVNEVTE
jgi:hypothetical protein